MSWQIRHMQERDLPQVLGLQGQAYSGLVETDAAIASRLQFAPDYCWVAEAHGVVGAYLLAHPWPHTLPPTWNQPLTRLPAHATRLYLHDLALGQAARGSGVARRLIHTVLQKAGQQRFHEVVLIAVQDSSGFWRRFGFREIQAANATLQEKLVSYGEDARLMSLSIGR